MNDDSNLTVPMPNLPTDWCFNMEMWLTTVETPNISSQMQLKYAHYKEFSFRYNGILTLMLILFGFTGSIFLLKQVIYSSRVFSKRLAVHLGMICFWDIQYLFCCLSTYCIPSLIYSVTPIYGPFSYILFILQPFASFCVSCTIWQVFAITLERYYAVSYPLEQRTRKAKFGVGWICLAIAVFAFVLNLLPVPFENELVDCYEIKFDENGSAYFRNDTMMKPYFDDKIRLYRFVVHFFPDLLFRAPIPIIVIGTLTVRTIQACSQRSVGNFQIGMRFNRNMPLRLSLLNFKFILCNTLYMFNTILLELLEYGNMENGDYDGYINSFYLTDASNMLLVVHSATNWLIFSKFPTWSKKDAVSSTLTTSIKCSSIKHRVADYINKNLTPVTPDLGIEIIQKLCDEMPEVRDIVFANIEKEKDKQERITMIGTEVGQFLSHIFKWFGDRNKRNTRKILYKQYTEAALRAKVSFKANQWKQVRSIVVEAIVSYVVANGKDQTLKNCGTFSTADIEECTTRVFNYVMSEMRSGVLCANVEEKLNASRSDRFMRSNSTASPAQASREVPRKSQSVSMRFQYSASVDSHVGEQHQLINTICP